jgi:hypothetical protein
MAACLVGLNFESTARRSLQTGKTEGAVLLAWLRLLLSLLSRMPFLTSRLYLHQSPNAGPSLRDGGVESLV